MEDTGMPPQRGIGFWIGIIAYSSAIFFHLSDLELNLIRRNISKETNGH